MINKLMTKLNEWFSEPLGNTLPSDSAETELKHPQPFYERFKALSGRMRGRGDKREPNQRIDEFHPRGAAGRREVRGPRGVSKALMPRPDHRVTSQKKK
jgi:hypothetical protein